MNKSKLIYKDWNAIGGLNWKQFNTINKIMKEY